MRTLILCLIVAATALAGCSDSGGSEPTPTPGLPTAEPTQVVTQGRNYTVEFDASATSGTVPLEVTFQGTVLDTNADDESDIGDVTWEFNPGDGGAKLSGDGSQLPFEHTYEYGTGGSFTAKLTVTAEDDEVIVSDITISVEADLGEPPETHFEFGPSLGCVGDTETCISILIAQETGDFSSGIDGHWIPLDQRYWGGDITGTSGDARGDSDCYFFNEALEIIGNAHNGAGPCEGTVGKDSAWVFVYPYAAPATDMVVDFIL